MSVFLTNAEGQQYVEQDPSDILDYTLDWAPWLGVDTITDSVWTVSPSGLTLNNDVFNDTLATTFISGGLELNIFTVTNRITTAGGRTKDRSFNVVIKSQ